MTLYISIEIDELKTEVKRVLSSYGKRRKDNQGNTMFAGVTTSVKEDPMLSDFMWKGIEVFLGEMSPLVDGSKLNDTLMVVFNSNRVNETKVESFKLNMKSFVTAYVLAKALTASGLLNEEKEAEADMQRHLDAAVKLLFTVDAPTAGDKNVKDMTGEVILAPQEDKKETEP